MQSALETETRGKAEALRMKKKLESDVMDLDLLLRLPMLELLRLSPPSRSTRTRSVMLRSRLMRNPA